jgi:hypothetical protein
VCSHIQPPPTHESPTQERMAELALVSPVQKSTLLLPAPVSQTQLQYCSCTEEEIKAKKKKTKKNLAY